MAELSGRLVYTEPNLYAAEAAGIKFGNGKIATNMTWKPEDLNISVDLQVVVPSRSDCGDIIENLPVTFSNGLGVYTSFLSGSKVGDGNYLTTDYTEASYHEIRSNSVSTTESLGISSIDVNFDAHFYPQVTMKFTDVRGYSLYMPAEEEYVNRLQDKAYKSGNATKPGRPYTNLFKAVFHFPYPKFLLTIKGFYGNKVTFILAVNDFKTVLNGQNGNFDVTISFIGYMYGLYTDIPMSYIMIAPYLDAKDGQLTESSYWKQQSRRFVSKAASSSGEGENATQPIPTFLELARNYAELDIESEDTLGTETEKYYTLQSAYNSLSDIIKDYKDLVSEFGYDANLSTISGKTNMYDLYLLNNTEKYSWNNNDRANTLFNKVAEHISKYSGEEFKNCKIGYPILLREEADKGNNFTIEPAKLPLMTVKLDETRKKIVHNGNVIFSGLTYDDAKSNDSHFENKLFGLLRNKEEGGEFRLLAFNGEEWTSQLKDALKTIGEIRDSKMKDAAKSAVKLYSDKLGYTLTIENVFRMLFAHVECFFHYYLENTVYKIRDDEKRTFKNYDLRPEETDSDGIALTDISKLLPFPALYDRQNLKELVYPGEDMRTVDMLEVDLVERLHDAAKMCGEEAAKVSELMTMKEQLENSGQNVASNDANFPLPISFDGSFKPLTFVDAFCGSKNPYTNLPKAKTEDKPNYNLVDEILYMAYLRYCAYKMCIEDDASQQYGSNATVSLKVKRYFTLAEYNNIITAFPTLNQDLKKELGDLWKGLNKEYLSKALYDGRLAARVGNNFSIPYTGNTILCTGFDTSTDTGLVKTEDNTYRLNDSISIYTKDYLRGVYVFPASTFDVFKSMRDTSVYTEKEDRYDFKPINKSFDIREADAKDYYQKIVGLPTVPFNSVYKLGEKGRKYFSGIFDDDSDDAEKPDSNNLINNIKDILNNTKRDVYNYFDFVKQDRPTKDSYIGMYSPGPLFTENNNKSGRKNLLATRFFWSQPSDEARAFLLLSAYIGSSDNKFLYDDILTRVGVRPYRLRKLSVLYYGALIHRLRQQVNTLKEQEGSQQDDIKYIGTDLVSMYDTKGDTFGINKDIFNEHTYTSVQKDSYYVKYGEYYYPEAHGTISRRKFTNDAPKLSALSIVDSKKYNEFTTGGKLEKKIIVPLSSTLGSTTLKIGENLKTSLEELLEACDTSSKNIDSLESYFLNWVNTEFKDFLNLLLNSYVSIEKDPEKGIKVHYYPENWIDFNERLNNSAQKEKMLCFKYSEEENSPNMFLNKLQCEQVTVLMCVPNEETVKSDKPDKFLETAATVFGDLFGKLHEYYSAQTGETKEQMEQSVEGKHDVDDSSLKKATYYTLKSLYDKWICGYGKFDQFQLPTPHEEFEAKRLRYEQGDYYGDKEFKEMNNFLFVDAFYNDISDTFYCNPKLLYDLIMSCVGGEYKCSAYQFMAKLAQDNKLLMKAFPVYNNFYNINTINDIFTPHMSYDVANESMVKRGFGSTYVLMYTNQPSKFLNEESKNEIVYRDDGLDLGDSLGHAAKMEARFSHTDGALNLPVPAFGVTYAMQNQQYFKGMNINMDNPITTDYSIANTLMLSQTGAKGDKNFPMGVGQDIYAIYSNRSYTITVEMMGCANIMPMMYFQLNNVPMFKGAYMIVSVSHSIKAGTMTTTFTGIRQTKYLYPTVTENMILTSIVDRMNKERSEQSSSRGNSLPANVEGSKITETIDGVNIILDNALGENYSWVPKSDGKPYPYKKRLSGPKHIILHYTAGTSSAPGMAGKLMSTWVNIWNNSETGGGSADFGVDDGGIYQFTPDVDKWRASYCNGGDYKKDNLGGREHHDDAHLCGIGIEICCTHKKGTSFKEGNHDGWSFTNKVLENTAKLCAYLIKTHPQTMPCDNIDAVKRIISTHYRVSGKICPGIRGWNTAMMSDGTRNTEAKLNEFMETVWKELQKLRKK